MSTLSVVVLVVLDAVHVFLHDGFAFAYQRECERVVSETKPFDAKSSDEIAYLHDQVGTSLFRVARL